jgi:hypothetical protein
MSMLHRLPLAAIAWPSARLAVDRLSGMGGTPLMPLHPLVWMSRSIWRGVKS